MFRQFFKLLSRLSPRQILVFTLIIILGILVSFLDLGTVFLVSNLISLLSGNPLEYQIPILSIVISNNLSPTLLTSIVIVWIISAASLRFLFLASSSFFSSTTGHQIASLIYNSFLQSSLVSWSQQMGLFLNIEKTY